MKRRKIKVVCAVALFFLASCANNPYKGLTVLSTVDDENLAIAPLVFKDLSKGKLYKAKVEILKNYLSGLLMIKKVKGSKRVIFTSETGLKFFDFAFAPDTFIVHQIMEQFDNKHVVNTLKEDIGALVNFNTDGPYETVALKAEQGGLNRRKDGGDWMYYYYQEEQLNKIERASDKKKKVIITFENYIEDIPQLINIAHKDFKMNIELNYIKR
ncbi:MAG: hypothetical protein HOK72_07205 [Flavobacteriales bacterium]|nr:hypothetical protein [Flavobacteriales bacterium]